MKRAPACKCSRGAANVSSRTSTRAPTVACRVSADYIVRCSRIPRPFPAIVPTSALRTAWRSHSGTTTPRLAEARSSSGVVAANWRDYVIARSPEYVARAAPNAPGGSVNHDGVLRSPSSGRIRLALSTGSEHALSSCAVGCADDRVRFRCGFSASASPRGTMNTVKHAQRRSRASAPDWQPNRAISLTSPAITIARKIAALSTSCRRVRTARFRDCCLCVVRAFGWTDSPHAHLRHERPRSTGRDGPATLGLVVQTAMPRGCSPLERFTVVRVGPGTPSGPVHRSSPAASSGTFHEHADLRVAALERVEVLDALKTMRR